MASWDIQSSGPVWPASQSSAYENGVLKENAPMSVEQAKGAMRAATQTNELPAIQLQALSSSELPPHEALANQSSVDPSDLADTILNQALSFMENVLPAFILQDNLAKSKHSSATVSIRSLEKGKEKWTARVSGHDNQQIAGTASWEQFNQKLRVSHNRQEMEYVPEIEDAYKVCDWTIKNHGTWADITCEAFEMLFKENFPLKPRACSVLVVIGSSTLSSQFIIAQIPIDLSSAPGARYANGRNTIDVTANKSGVMGKKPVIGEYISIDRVKLSSEPNVEDKTQDNKVWWEKVISIDAKSSSPLGSSKLGSKSVIVRDVGSFIKYVNDTGSM